MQSLFHASAFILASVATIAVSTAANAELGRSPREARIAFVQSLPQWCQSGWHGHALGLIAICTLGDRYQARFLDGSILTCAQPGCADRSEAIADFLARQ